MVRNIGALVVGVLTLGLVVLTLQQVSTALHPLPEGLDPFAPEDAEAFAAHMEGMPTAAWVVAMLSEVLGAFLGALATGWIGRSAARPLSSVIVGVALAGSVANWTAFTHPTWFIGAQLILYPGALMLVWLLIDQRPPAEAEGRS